MSLYVAKSLCAFGLQKLLNMHKKFPHQVSRVCDLYVPNKFHARYRHVEYALNAFGARLKQASVRSMRVPILLDVASVACPKRV